MNDVTRVVEEISKIGIVVDAVQENIVLIRTAPVRTESVASGVARSRLAGGNAGAKLRQLRKIPPIERQIYHTAIVDNLTQLRGLGFEERSNIGDRNLFRNCPHLEGNVDHGALLYLHFDGFGHRRFEPVHCYFHRITAYGQWGCHIVARTASGSDQ